jgi:hypothetical protein
MQATCTQNTRCQTSHMGTQRVSFMDSHVCLSCRSCAWLLNLGRLYVAIELRSIKLYSICPGDHIVSRTTSSIRLSKDDYFVQAAPLCGSHSTRRDKSTPHEDFCMIQQSKPAHGYENIRNGPATGHHLLGPKVPGPGILEPDSCILLLLPNMLNGSGAFHDTKLIIRQDIDRGSKNCKPLLGWHG